MDKEQIIKEYMSSNGKKGGPIGGNKTKEKYGENWRQHYIEIGRKGGLVKKSPNKMGDN